MRLHLDVDRVVKIAESDEERIALRREARALRVCAHPGVVALLATEGGDPPQALVLPRLSGGSMEERGCPSVETLVGWGAAIASTLADLHGIGWVHGSLSAGHVLFDADSKPVLCSFGRSEAPTDRGDLLAGAAADVAALATSLLGLLPEDADRRVLRYLTAVAGRPAAGRATGWIRSLVGPSGPPARNPARQMAARLIELVPEARLGSTSASGAEAEVQPDSPGRGRRRAVGAVLIGLCAATAAVVAALTATTGHRAARPAGGPTMAVSDRFLLTGPPGAQMLTVIGRWDCGVPRPAVEDLRTGWIWVFDRWPPPGSADSARPVGRVSQPAGLAVRRSAPGCEQLVAIDASGRLEVMAAPAGP